MITIYQGNDQENDQETITFLSAGARFHVLPNYARSETRSTSRFTWEVITDVMSKVDLVGCSHANVSDGRGK